MLKKEIFVFGLKSRGKYVFNNLLLDFKKIKIIPVKIINKSFKLNNKTFNEIDLYEHLIKRNTDIIIFICNVSFRLKKNWNIFKTFVLHGGPVPKYRGASVINWQILQNERFLGLSLLKFSRKLDAGKLVMSSTICIENIRSLDEIRSKIDESFYDMVKSYLVNKKIRYLKQNGAILYWKKRTLNDSYFDPKDTTLKNFLLLFKSTEIDYRPYYLYKNKYYQIINYKIDINKINAKKNFYLNLSDYKILITRFRIL